MDAEPHWTRWYNRKRWRKLRARQLTRVPWCERCKAETGKVVLATIAHHVTPHAGDPVLFYDEGNLASSCWSCHERSEKFEAARGYSKAIDPTTGWPIDARHPANAPREHFKIFGYGVPHHLRPSAVETFLVCGAPASGKSTWVNAHKRPGDVVISLDELKVKAGGRMWDTDPQIKRRALAMRDAMLRTLATRSTGRAFVVVGAPREIERRAWCQALGIGLDHVIVLDTPADVCVARLRSDPARAHAAADLINGVQRWHYLARQAA